MNEVKQNFNTAMFSFFLYVILVSAKLVTSYVIVLSGEGDILKGETAQFKAEVLQDDGTPVPDVEFKFKWTDNAVPQNTAEFVSYSPALWNVTYNSTSPSDLYTVSVKGYEYIIFLWTIFGNASKTFNVTDYVKGDLVLSQENTTRNKYISNVEPVTHQLVLQKSHLNFLNKTKNFLRTFWFVDCMYYGQETGFDFNFNYTKVESVHFVEALLVATYIPGLSETHMMVSNSTVKTSFNSTVSGTNNTDASQVENKNSTASDISNKTVELNYLDHKLVERLENFNKSQRSSLSKPEYCLNSSALPVIFNYTYGFFRKNFTVKAPVKISPVNGTNWLMDGEILNINVSCNGSSPYSFCVLLKAGLYNVTGNETCKEETVLRNCSFGIQHLFKQPSEYTLVVIISNAVSHVVKPIAVNIYKVKKHAQLSVIIVPVSFSLIATTLIIFGVAYYVQSKRKYTIEVADFDFGNQTSVMEHKSFTERLRESISNSLLKSHEHLGSEDSWPESASNSRKYGSME